MNACVIPEPGAGKWIDVAPTSVVPLHVVVAVTRFAASTCVRSHSTRRGVAPTLVASSPPLAVTQPSSERSVVAAPPGSERSTTPCASGFKRRFPSIAPKSWFASYDVKRSARCQRCVATSTLPVIDRSWPSVGVFAPPVVSIACA